MAAMTVAQFKEFVSNIPEDFDKFPIWFVDFAYTDSLQCIVNEKEEVEITENDDPCHSYINGKKVIKETPT